MCIFKWMFRYHGKRTFCDKGIFILTTLPCIPPPQFSKRCIYFGRVGGMAVRWCTCGGQRTKCSDLVSPSTCELWGANSGHQPWQ